MSRTSRRRCPRSWLTPILIGLLVPAVTLAQTKTDAETAPPDESTSPNLADEVIFLSKEAAKLINQLPTNTRIVLMSQERYQELLKQLNELKGKPKPTAPLSVNECEVTGSIDGKVAQLRVTITLSATGSNGMVLLGCKKGEPTEVLLDGKTPILTSTPKGLMLQVPAPGPHVVTLRLKVPITKQDAAAMDNDLREGFEIDLPETVLPTKIKKLQVPKGTSGLRVNDLDVDAPTANEVSADAPSSGALKITWTTMSVRGDTKPSLSARGSIDAYLDPGHLTIRGQFVLKSRGKPVSEWRMRLPAGANVALADAAAGNEGITIQRKKEKGKSKDVLVTITLPAPTTESLTVVVTMKQARAKGELPLMGPFTVLDATTQQGSLRFHGAPNEWVSCRTLRSDDSFRVTLLRRAVTPTEKQEHQHLISVFDYFTQGLTMDTSATSAPWIEPRLSTSRGRVDARTIQTVRLKIDENGRPVWRLTAQIEVTPIEQGIDHIEVVLPKPWKLTTERGARPLDVRVVPAGNERYVLRFAKEQVASFSVQLEATHEESTTLADVALVTMPLLYPLSGKTWDRGNHKITVEVPASKELDYEPAAHPDLDLRERRPHQLTWQALRFPKTIQFRCKKYQAQQRVDSLIDLELHGTHVLVHHELIYVGNGTFPDEVELDVPETVRLRVRPLQEPAEGRRFRFRPVVEASRQRALVKISYWFALKPEQRQTKSLVTDVPLVRPVDAAQGQLHVRAWGSIGWSVSSAEPGWQVRPLESVAEHADLPLWVGEAGSPHTPLKLRWRQEATHSPLTVERVLYQVRILEGGLQQHRARFRIRVDGRSRIELALPGAPSKLRLQLLLDGKGLKNYETINAGADGTHVRIGPVELGRHQVHELTVHCQTSSPRLGNDEAFRTTIHPVRVVSNESPYPVRWQVDLPPGISAIAWNGSDRDAWRWGLQGFLFGPQPAATAADLEKWFLGESPSASSAASRPAVVSASSSLAPLTITHVPQQAWMMVCSVSVLALGLLCAMISIGRTPGGAPRRCFWSLIALVCTVLATISLVHPYLIASIVKGSQPGLAVLVVSLVLYRTWQGRRHGRVMMMPGFRPGKRSSIDGARTKADPHGVSTSSHVPLSSVHRGSSQEKIPQPSTIDPPVDPSVIEVEPSSEEEGL